MSQDLNLRLRITGDGSGLKGEIRTASGEVVKFSDQLEGGSKRGTRALRETEKQTGRLSNTTQKLTRRIAAVAAGYLSFQTVNRTLRTVTQNTLEQERLWRQLEAGIEATGGAAGRSLSQLQGMSRELQATTTYSNEQVEAVQAQLLAFRNVSEDVFDRTLGLVLDFAQTTGRDATQAVRTLALAINDPLQGMGRLSQAGISLNKQLQETVRELVETGRLTEAQDLLLNELSASFGGAATAARDTFGGALQAVRNDFDDLLKFTGDMPALAAEIEAISDRLRDPELRDSVEEGIAAALGLIPPAIDAGVSAIEIIVPLMTATADNADKIKIAVEVLAAVLAGRLVASLTAATVAKRAAIAESIRYQAALASMAGLSHRAAAGQLALAGASRAASGALALVGGPIGALTVGIGALALASRSYARDLDDLANVSDESRSALDRLAKLTGEDWDHRPIQAYRNDLKILRDELEETIEQINELQSGPSLERRDRIEPFGGGSHDRELTALQERRSVLEDQIEIEHELIRLREHQAGVRHHEDLAAGLDLLSQAGDAAVDVMERIGLVSRNAAGGLGEMADARSKLTDPLDEKIAELEREAAVLRMVTEGNRTAAEAQLEYQYQLDLAAAKEADAEDATNANVAAVEEKYARLRELSGQVEEYQKATNKAAKAEQQHAQRIQKLGQAYGQLLAAANPLAARQQELSGQLSMMQELAGLSSDQLRQMGIDSELLAQVIAHLREQIEGLDADPFAHLSDEVKDILDWVDGLDMDPLIRDIRTLEEALEDATDPEVIARLEQAIGRLRGELHGAGLDVGEMMMAYGQASAQALRSIQHMAERGSREYQAIQVAIEAANVSAAVGAVLNQGMGDPYTAFARMAAMAAAVANLGYTVGSIGGSGPTAAEQRQETQGTGTVLGAPDAKSESIARASQITADATSKLVGINRGMLRALQQLQAGIAGATNMLARGPGQSEFDFGMDFDRLENHLNRGAMQTLESVFDPAKLFRPITGLIGSWLGGSSRVEDEGIKILGGSIQQLIDDVMVTAFQEVSFKKWKFGGRKWETAEEDLPEDLGNQISLIFESMADAVREGAKALGISSEEIDRAIESFRVEERKISLMDLSPEEQQAELEAVFSEIFDGLAGHVVPWVDEFQKVGESAAETLIRVATGVQVTEEAVKRLGFAADQTDPQKFARISEGLIEMVGGIEQLIAGTNNFVDKFADEATKFDMAQSDVTRALEGVGLELPETREGFWLLMQQMDANTEAGREQIAMLLELADTADAYYSQLEKIEQERAGLQRQLLQLEGDTAALRELELAKLDDSNHALQRRIWALEEEIEREKELAGIQSDVTEELAQLTLSPLRKEFRDLSLSFRELYSRAQELGASEELLGDIRAKHDLQLQRLAGRLEESLRSIAEQLSGGGASTASSAFGSSSFSSPIEDAANRIRDQLIRALEGVEEWLRRSSFEDPSLTPRQRFRATQAEFDRLVDVALTGTGEERADAIDKLPQLASELEALGVRMHGSATEPFQEFRAGIVEAMEKVMGIDVPEAKPDPVTGSQVGHISSQTESIANSSARQRDLAAQFLEELGVLVRLTGDAPADLAAEMGMPLAKVIEMLIGEVNEQTIETVDQLVAVANTLGAELTTVADAVGLHIGELANQESMLSQALQDAVLRMPEGVQEQLWGPLRDIWSATNEADANAAIADLEAVTADLPAEYKNLLAPFFEAIDPVDFLLHEIGLLESIETINDRMARSLDTIARLIKSGQPIGPGTTPMPGDPTEPPPVEGMATGGWATGLKMTGERGPELILPHDVSSFFHRAGVPVNVQGAGSDPRIAEYLHRIVQLEEEAKSQREQLTERQIVTVDGLSESVREAARLEASNRGMFS